MNTETEVRALDSLAELGIQLTRLSIYRYVLDLPKRGDTCGAHDPEGPRLTDEQIKAIQHTLNKAKKSLSKYRKYRDSEL